MRFLKDRILNVRILFQSVAVAFLLLSFLNCLANSFANEKVNYWILRLWRQKKKPFCYFKIKKMKKVIQDESDHDDEYEPEENTPMDDEEEVEEETTSSSQASSSNSSINNIAGSSSNVDADDEDENAYVMGIDEAGRGIVVYI